MTPAEGVGEPLGPIFLQQQPQHVLHGYDDDNNNSNNNNDSNNNNNNNNSHNIIREWYQSVDVGEGKVRFVSDKQIEPMR